MVSHVIVTLIVLLRVPPADAPPRQDDPRARAQPFKIEKFQATLEEYQKRKEEFDQAYRKASNQDERARVLHDKFPDKIEYAERFWALAEAAPDDPSAFDALLWCAQLGRNTSLATKAIDRLAARHAENPRLSALTDLLEQVPGDSAETLLRAIAARNPDRGARGRASFMLGRWLNRRLELVQLVRDQPGRLAAMEDFLKNQGLDPALLARSDPTTLTKEAEAVFERVAKEYGDVHAFQNTLARLAGDELHEMRAIVVGRPCPEISGQDLDGKAFTLSEFKGNVVLVDFWRDG